MDSQNVTPNTPAAQAAETTILPRPGEPAPVQPTCIECSDTRLVDHLVQSNPAVWTEIKCPYCPAPLIPQGPQGGDREIEDRAMWMADSRPLLAEIASLAKERDEANLTASQILCDWGAIQIERDALLTRVSLLEGAVTAWSAWLEARAVGRGEEELIAAAVAQKKAVAAKAGVTHA